MLPEENRLVIFERAIISARVLGFLEEPEYEAFFEGLDFSQSSHIMNGFEEQNRLRLVWNIESLVTFTYFSLVRNDKISGTLKMCWRNYIVMRRRGMLHRKLQAQRIDLELVAELKVEEKRINDLVSSLTSLELL